MKLTLFSLFPHWFDGPLGESILGRAREKGLFEWQVVNPRDFATDVHGTVDGQPYGGGGGMVLRADVLARALDATVGAPGAPNRPHVIYLSPRGRVLDQGMAIRLARLPAMALLCGHYEAVDQRLLDTRVDEEISLGDFVLTGGEIPAMALVDAIVRLLPGALGQEDGALTESFMGGMLEGPHYTRPAEFEGIAVPPVLGSGNHGAVAKWREEQALRETARRRPELYERLLLHPDQVRRLARRGRPFAIWEQVDGGNRLLYAPARVKALIDDPEAIFNRRWEKGLSPTIRLAEIKEAFGETAEEDRLALHQELKAIDWSEHPVKTRQFLLNLLGELDQLSNIMG
ncbi:MAG: tRNA (guanosine(37)-N1)-methyltransferase TrmD [Candidatus Sumerlaeia bacterium]|nr:tRNA (guanosine(37)-N1)-methyltransferase TrmD [Candidatus Sumerlaeia bacterium]